MTQESSKTVVYENGDIQNIEATKEVLYAYWRLNECERKAFRITMSKYQDPPQDFIELEKSKP